jgi:UDP-galactopyranose mutase
MYDYVIAGAGFYGATFARLATDAGKKCLVIDSRKHIGGNAYSEKREGIDVHMYGPHIFHTNDKDIWNFINQFSEFNNFILSPKSYTKGKLYSLPFNMNTFYEIWNCITPEQAKDIIQKQKFLGEPKNLEEQALSLVGKDIYELLIREYTMKQWQKHPKELPSFIIKRLPLRFTFDNNYFDDRYQGIPVNGYTKIFEVMLDGIEVRTNTDYFQNKNHFDSISKKVVFTGKIDEYFNYEFGELEYRSLDFIHKTIHTDNFQGNAVINYPDISIPWTRMIEHKHFTKTKSDVTIVTSEIPTEWNRNKVPYYPVNDTKNNSIYQKYRDKADSLENVIFGGRLARYQYMDMHQVIGSAMKDVKTELHK